LSKLFTHTASVTKQYNWYQHKLGSKQAHRKTHWPRVHGHAASASVWLRATESEIKCLTMGQTARERSLLIKN